MDGKGDIVKEFLTACQNAKMKCGLYLSPWDRHEEKYGCYNDEKTYDKFYITQLTELLTRYDVDLFELWFDGAGSEDHTYDWERIINTVEKYQPQALIFNMGKPTVRWVGNELGLTKESHWNVVQEGAALEPIDDETRNLGMKISECDGLGNLWMPAECDTPIHHYHWFWHPKDDSSLKSLEELMHIYHHSVGRGANLLLNIAPNPEGLLDAVDVERAKEFGGKIRQLYSHPISQIRGEGKLLEMGINPSVQLHALILQENISKGQRIREYYLEFQSESINIWQLLYHGTSIRYKRIEQINFNGKIKKIRLRVVYSFGKPLISNFAIF